MKSDVYIRRILLAGSTNFFNRRLIFVKERLPKFGPGIQTEASELNLVTIVRNFEVRVFVKKQTIKYSLLESKVGKCLKTWLHERFKVRSNMPVGQNEL